MPALDRNVEVTCETFGVQITKLNLARHKKRCSAGTLFCTQCPNCSTKSRDDLFIILPNNTVQQQQDLQKHTSVNCVTQNFPAFMLYVNTKILNMEHKLGLKRAILMLKN